MQRTTFAKFKTRWGIQVNKVKVEHIGKVTQIMKCYKEFMAQRWRDEKELNQYLMLIEEAEKRDHRKIGTELDFSLSRRCTGCSFLASKWLDNIQQVD